jgi:hypothetical protein
VALLLPRVWPAAMNLVMGKPILILVPLVIAIQCWFAKIRQY